MSNKLIKSQRVSQGYIHSVAQPIICSISPGSDCTRRSQVKMGQDCSQHLHKSRPGVKPESSSNILRRRQSFTYADSRLDPPVLPDSGWTPLEPSVSVQSKLLPERPHASSQSVRKAPVGMKGDALSDESKHSLVEKYKAESAARKQASVQQAGSVSRTGGSVKLQLPSHQAPSVKPAVAASSGKQPLLQGKLKSATELRVTKAADRAATPMRASKAQPTAQGLALAASRAKQPRNGSQNSSESDSN
ncbi:hypothetical protein WJX79_004764 [Trebouxia sp. C0005]